MNKFDDIAERAGGAGGLLVGEVTSNLVRQLHALAFPRPEAVRAPRQANGDPWPGDGLGPYTAEFRAWDDRRRSFTSLVAAGGFGDAAKRCLPPGWRLMHLGRRHAFDRWCAQIFNDGCEERIAMVDQIAMISRTGETEALAVIAVAALAWNVE